MITHESGQLVDNWDFISSAEIHLWYTPLALPETSLHRFAHLLSIDERHRATNFRFDDDRWRWIASRLYLRALVARYLDCEPQEITFRYGEFGKPFIKDAPLQFNLSHTKQVLGYGVSKSLVLGIDVEHINPAIDYLDLARNFFAPSEVNTLASAPSAIQPDLFFRLWTRKEAYLKATGQGIGEGLDRHPSDVWTLETFPLSPDHILSVAVFSPNCHFKLMLLPHLETLL